MAYEVKYVAQAPDYQVELLDYNEYSRPGTALSQVNGIVIHYTANPGTTAEQNRSYFENLKDTGGDICQQPFCHRHGRGDRAVHSVQRDCLRVE